MKRTSTKCKSKDASKKVIWCKICLVPFDTKDLFEAHMISEERMRCKFCGTTVTAFATLNRHIKHFHSDNKELPYCRRCKEHFLTIDERNRHIKQCTRCRWFGGTLQNYQCDLCMRYYGTQFEMISHLQNKHSFLFKNTKVVSNIKILKSRMFYNKLKTRVNQHPDWQFVVYCTSCEKDIVYDEYFSTHYMQCFLQKDFVCPFCNITKDNIRSDFQVHIDRHFHLNNDISICDDCNVAFFNCINYFKHNSSVHFVGGRRQFPRQKIIKATPRLFQITPKTCAKKQSDASSSQVTPQSRHENSQPLQQLGNFVRITPKVATTTTNVKLNVIDASKPKYEPSTPKNAAVKTVNIVVNVKKLEETIGNNFRVVVGQKTQPETASNSVLANVKIVNDSVANDLVVNNEHAYSANTSGDTYKCPKCDDEIPKSQMVKHTALHLYKCPFCTQVFDTSNHVRTHLALPDHADTDLYEFLADDAFYEKYKKSFFSRQYLKRVVYLVDRPKTTIEYIDENQCKVCSVKFQFHCQLLRHQISIKHDINIIQCGACKEKFCSKFMYDYHLTLHADEIIHCQICKINLPTIETFIEHLEMIHTEDNTFGIECSFCYDLKLNEEKLNKHNNKYHRDGKYMCRLCDSKFESSPLLNSHRAFSHSLVMFKCNNCDAQFSTKQFEAQHAASCFQTF